MDTNLDAPDAQLPRGGPNRISPTLRQVNAKADHHSWNPDRPVLGSPVWTTHACTWPGRRVVDGSSWISTRSRSIASMGPWAQISTRPSSILRAKPIRPSSRARARVHQRNPTPWTRPRTKMVVRSMSLSLRAHVRRDTGAGTRAPGHRLQTCQTLHPAVLSLIHISEPTRQAEISYAV